MATVAEYYNTEPRSLRTVAIELLLALLIVLVFFFIVFGVTNWYLPVGISVKEIASSLGGPVATTDTRELAVTSLEDSGTPLTAKVSQVTNRVNVKPSNAIAWSTAHTGQSLLNRDALQTYEKARAVVEFDKQNYLDIGPNSLVVFQQGAPSVLRPQTRTLRLVVEGELRGRLSRTAESAVADVKVALPNTELDMRASGAAEGEVEFQLNVKKDQSSTLSIQGGSVELKVGGRDIHLQPDQALSIDTRGQPQVVPRPRAPSLRVPHHNAANYYRDLPPRLEFSWDPSPEATGYRFMLARDAQFRQIVADEQLSRTTFAYGNLHEGSYYWRVHTLRDDVESRPSEQRELSMVQDRQPPRLYLQAPPKVTRQATVNLIGRTEPGSRVLVEGQPVRVQADGSFRHRLELKPGASLIVIEAIDPAGNVAYATNLVTRKF